MSTHHTPPPPPPGEDVPETPSTPTWTPPPKPTFNSPAADLNQLRNEAKRVAESAPSQPVHKAVLDRARALARSVEHDLGLPDSADGLCYADLAVLLSQSK
ncbi:MAG: hypothetical protein ACLGG9_06480 [Thermoleophilia bacterium]